MADTLIPASFEAGTSSTFHMQHMSKKSETLPSSKLAYSPPEDSLPEFSQKLKAALALFQKDDPKGYGELPGCDKRTVTAYAEGRLGKKTPKTAAQIHAGFLSLLADASRNATEQNKKDMKSRLDAVIGISASFQKLARQSLEGSNKGTAFKTAEAPLLKVRHASLEAFPAWADPEKVAEEIAHSLKRLKLERPAHGQFIEVIASPESKGWTREEVTCTTVGDYSPPPEFRNMMDRFEPNPPINGYYSLRRSSHLPIADDDSFVSFDLEGGTWHHVSALSKIFANRFDDPECRAFRTKFESSWLIYSEDEPLASSRLYHNVNAETLVLSADGYLIFGKRHSKMIFGGAWSASLEEQMLRKDPKHPRRRDEHVFDAAERGVREELAATVIPEETRLLKVGIEWGNFTAAFLFLVRCRETFSGIVECWKNAVHDQNEAIALDGLPATPANLTALLKSPSYSPSRQWRQRVSVETPAGWWHPTAHARIKALLDHVQYLRGERH